MKSYVTKPIFFAYYTVKNKDTPLTFWMLDALYYYDILLFLDKFKTSEVIVVYFLITVPFGFFLRQNKQKWDGHLIVRPILRLLALLACIYLDYHILGEYDHLQILIQNGVTWRH